jgi:hypothetical protein
MGHGSQKSKSENPQSNNGQAVTDAAGLAHRKALVAGQECFDAALEYLALGWSVLAVCPPDHVGVGAKHGRDCDSPGKAPWGPWTEYQDRLPTEEELRQKWHDNPRLNVGLALGPVSGLIRIDVDGPGGEKRLQELSGGDLPDTLEFTSGRDNGGYGRLYKIPPGVQVQTTHEKPGREKEELRFQAKGAQTVLPPSRHVSGARYEWKPGHSPGERQAALAPPWLVKALQGPKPGAPGGKQTKPLADGEMIPEGQRDDTLTSLAGTMRRRGFTEGAIFAALMAENKERCDPPLDEESVRKIARSVARYEPAGPAPQVTFGRAGDGPPAKRVRTLEPYQAFPVEALPSPLGEYVRQSAAALGCDPAYIALPVLSVVSSVIGNTRTIRLKRDWQEPCIVWSVIVGESGTLKSPAYRMAVAYLWKVYKRQLKEHKEAVASYMAKLEEWKAKKREADKNDGLSPGDPPEEPVLRRVACSDTTIEKLAEILEDNPRGTLVARDELSAWLGSFSRYKARGAGSDLPNWLEIFRAGTVVVDRKTGERRRLFVERAAASVTGTIQPGVLAKALSPEFLDSGLAARLLLAMPVAPPKRWSEVEVAQHAEDAYHGTLDRLLALDFAVEGKEKVPHVLRLSTEAKLAWVEFYNSWAREQAAAEGELAAALSKLEAYAARFALIHHVVTCVHLEVDDRREVGIRSIRAGIALCFWFASEARRIYATFSETAEERASRKLLEHIRNQGGRITARQLQRSNCRKYPNSEAAEAALNGLVEAGLGAWEERATSPVGGRPVRRLVLNMTHDKTDTTPDGESGGNEWPADTTADTTPATPSISQETEGCVGFVMRHIDDEGSETAPPGQDGSVGRGEVVSDGEHGDAWEGD